MRSAYSSRCDLELSAPEVHFPRQSARLPRASGYISDDAPRPLRRLRGLLQKNLRLILLIGHVLVLG